MSSAPDHVPVAPLATAMRRRLMNFVPVSLVSLIASVAPLATVSVFAFEPEAVGPPSDAPPFHTKLPPDLIVHGAAPLIVPLVSVSVLDVTAPSVALATVSVPPLTCSGLRASSDRTL